MKYVLALLADWANGVFAVLVSSHIFGIDPLWWHFLIGILLSHVLDLDAIPELLHRGTVAASKDNPVDHREGLHYPLLVIPVCGMAAFLWGYWGLILLFNVILHFLNDFYGTGWGVKWLWPFNRNNYKLLSRRANQPKFMLVETGIWDTLPDDERRLRLIVSWTHTELVEYIKRWGIEDWIEQMYLKLTVVSVIEYSIFCSAFILLLLELLSS